MTKQKQQKIDLPLISIIVPVYNVEQYLPACIRSILRQTYQDFELILVDDGSPDRCGEICEEFAKEDSRITVLHQPNEGVSRARNAGMDHARGEWVCFIDADDLVTPGYLAAFRPVAPHESDVDMIVQGAIGFFGKKIRNKFVFDSYSGDIKNCLTKELIDMRTPWGKLFRLDIIRENGLNFPGGVPYGEDTIFYYKYLFYVDKIRLRHETKYLNRTDNPNSATKRFYSPFVYWNVYEEKAQLLRQLYSKHDVPCPYPDPEDVMLLKSWVAMAYKSESPDAYSLFIKAVTASYAFRSIMRMHLALPDRLFCLFLMFPCWIQKSIWYLRYKIISNS